MEDYLPPCHGRTEWTRDTNKHTFKTEHQRQDDAAATLRAQFICMTQCEMRAQCMSKALAFEPEDDWFIWGGYSAWERERIRTDGLEVPSALKAVKVNWDRVNLLVDSNASVEDLADYWDMNASGLQSSFRSYLYLLRIEAGDPWLVLPDDVSGEEVPETEQTVRAA